ncbi:MAG: YdjY domain-containing protein [Planctomycetota bacterium]
MTSQCARWFQAGVGLLICFTLAGCPQSEPIDVPSVSQSNQQNPAPSTSTTENSDPEATDDKTREQRDLESIKQEQQSKDDSVAQTPAIDDEPVQMQEEIDYLKNPTIEIAEHWIHLFPEKELWIDNQSKKVIVGGDVFMNVGPLEMFICPGTSKRHESIVGVNALASEVHAGLVATGTDPGKPASWQNGYRPAFGPSINIEMIWKDAKTGEMKKATAQDWIRNVNTAKRMEADFVFGGSTMYTDPDTNKNFYLGDSGELVCLSNFSTATIDINVPSSEDNFDLLYEVFEGKVPPIGTHVYAVFSAGEMIKEQPRESIEPPKKDRDVVEPVDAPVPAGSKQGDVEADEEINNPKDSQDQLNPDQDQQPVEPKDSGKESGKSQE